jgi:hypothetical protein
MMWVAKAKYNCIIFPAVTFILQFSNFKATVIPTFLVTLLLPEVFIILVQSKTLLKVSDLGTLLFTEKAYKS